uniref:Chaoptin n=1 Tax=Culex pipiens TaxID=7175 RepID=A0A8D8FFN5_CULPI
MALTTLIILFLVQWSIPKMSALSVHPEEALPCLNRFTNPVNMSHCKITSLDPRHFPAHLPITTLNMSHNAKFDFPADGSPFLVQDHLLNYHCEHCGITAIYAKTFAELRRLKTLNLASNQLKTIPGDAFNRNQLHYLMVGGNEIRQINDEMKLETMQHLVMLAASGNVDFKLMELSLDFANLEWIQCKRCGMMMLAEQWFKRVKRLKKLSLEDNMITMISREMFSHNRRLAYVNLDGNPLEWLEIASDSLEVLSCAGCNLVQLNSNCFDALPKLQTLDLRSNKISSIDSTTFVNNRNLWRLILDDNNLTAFPEINLTSNTIKIMCIDDNPLQPSQELFKMKQLYKVFNLRKECSAGDNSLNQFEHTIPDHSLNGISLSKKNLPPCNETVDISNRNVAFIYPAVYEDCSSLTQLIMNNNSNYSFPHHRPFLFSKKLQTYSCIRCGIHALYEHTFSKLPALRTLDLSNNHITKIASFDLFSSNPQLQHLTLEHNRLTNLTVQLLSSHTKLIIVNLSHNPSLGLNPQLPILEQSSAAKFDASHCGITEISTQSFRLMAALEELDISHNPIVEIHPRAFEHNIKLRILDVSNTHLRMIDPRIFEGMTDLQRVHLHGLSRYNLEYDEFMENSKALWKLLTSRKLYGREGEQFIAQLAASFDDQRDIEQLDILNQVEEFVTSRSNDQYQKRVEIWLTLTGLGTICSYLSLL